MQQRNQLLDTATMENDPAADIHNAGQNLNEPNGPLSFSRRRFLRLAIKTSLPLFGGALYYGFNCEPDMIAVTHTDVHLKRWPLQANGFTIGQISDTHCDYQKALDRTRKAVELMLEQKPQMAVLTGDYLSSSKSRRFLKEQADIFAMLNQLPCGVYAVLGNHDWWTKSQNIIEHTFMDAGIDVLRNRSLPIPGVENAYVVGVDDPSMGAIDINKALRNVPIHSSKIVLMHEPDVGDLIGEGFDFQLSGHSHGGQVRLPFIPPIHTPTYARKYPEGLKWGRNHQIYTNRGIGMVGPQIRLFCPPEVSILTLYSTNA